jgi:hypothetical protein
MEKFPTISSPPPLPCSTGSRFDPSKGPNDSARVRTSPVDRWAELSDNENDCYKNYLSKVKRETEENLPRANRTPPSPPLSFRDKDDIKSGYDLEELKVRILQKMQGCKPDGDTIGESPQDLPTVPAAKNEKYKSRLCVLWARGKLCRYLDQCNFAHGEHEILKKNSRTRDDESPEKQRTRICDDFLSGICKKGNCCQFAHIGLTERDCPSAKRIKLEQDQLMGRQKKANICKHFLKNHCLWGTSCSFSHELSIATSHVAEVGGKNIPVAISAESIKRIFGLKAGLHGRNSTQICRADDRQRSRSNDRGSSIVGIGNQKRSSSRRSEDLEREIEMLNLRLKAVKSENQGLKSECKLLNLKLRVCQCGAADL